MNNSLHIKSFVKRSGRLTNSQKIYLKNKEKDLNFFSAERELDYKEFLTIIIHAF